MHSRWNPVANEAVIAFSIVMLILLFTVVMDTDGFIFLIDHANLMFHEAGHVIFGIFGPVAGLYGGTIGQLVFPIATGVAFWRQGATLSFGFSCIWFFENFLNIARYAGDARSRRLPLIGSGDHDWTNIMFRWNALEYDTTFAAILTTVAWLGMLGTWIWIIYRWRQ
ncbi:MAG: hypothetical protein MJA83_03640 [Gammaproteobacteria bacterium]|nr:hypothetical protein [Gammaproteobacteria bacterium]